MKRALAIAVAVCTLGVAGFGIGPISGSWVTELTVLPTLGLTSSTLTVNAPLGGFTLTSVTGFGPLGITTQRFGVTGPVGPFTLTGNIWFDPTVPVYDRSDLAASFDFGGIALGMTIRHWRMGEFAWPGETSPCAVYQTPDNVGMQYIFTGTIAPVTLRTRFLDCSFGIKFQDLRVDLTGLALCCGITFNVRTEFTRGVGFSFVEFTGLRLPFVLGITFDVAVRYTVDTKTVSLTPRFPGLGDACLAVFAAPVYDPARTLTAITLQGFQITCTIRDCYTFMYVHAWDVTAVNAILPAADDFLSEIRVGELLVTLGEYQLVRFGLCGPACCGGQWFTTFRFYFGTGGGLFDLTRLNYVVTLPIMVNLSVTASGNLFFVPAVPATLSIGWTFTF